MWNKIVCIAAGIWLIASTALLTMTDVATNFFFIAGPLILTFAVIALWEINEAVNKANLAIGAWLIVQPVFIESGSTATIISSIVTGIVLIVAAWFTAKPSQTYGGGWRSLMQDEPEHLVQSGK